MPRNADFSQQGEVKGVREEKQENREGGGEKGRRMKGEKEGWREKREGWRENMGRGKGKMRVRREGGRKQGRVG